MDQAILETIRDLLAAHGVPAQVRDGWVMPTRGAFPPIRAQLVPGLERPGSASMRLDVEVAASEEDRILECFAGAGADPAGAAANAVDNFCRGTLHVLLAALGSVVDEDQVAVEQWTVAGRVYHATLGNYAVRSFGGAPVHVPEEAFATLESLITSLPDAGELLWVRMFYANMNEASCVVEVLLDNEPWPAAQDAIRALPWERKPSFYSVRLFLILRRVD